MVFNFLLNNKFLFSTCILLLLTNVVFGQLGSIKGRTYDEISNEPIPFCNIILEGTTIGTTSDVDGNYNINNIPPGTYTLLISYIGYNPVSISEIMVGSARAVQLNIPMTASSTKLEEVVIKASPYTEKEESSTSLQTISASEIYRNPGSNRDISKVIQSLPGVSTTVSFRNDIIIRGGSPSENRFYLDGIEVPNINHFATQGSSGGPVGMINVNFIREVDFYSGAFPANRGNALSSVMEFKQTEANKDRISGTVAVGSSDFGLTLDGPAGKFSNFMFSARTSYLQFLFMALKLPFLPSYTDFQYKHVFNINKKNKLTLIGLGALDFFQLNTKVNDGVEDSTVIQRNNYILGYLPVNDQWNYTIGLKWEHYGNKNLQTFVASRSMLKNKSVKYKDNIEDIELQLLNYESSEQENKFRFENTFRDKGWKVVYGLSYEYAFYDNLTQSQRSIGDSIIDINYQTELNINKFGIFGQVSKKLFRDKLQLSLGLRTDFNDYSAEMLNPLNQISPRLSIAYKAHKKFSINASAGIFYQLPAYTVLGYSEDNILVNKDNVKYINCNHLVAGIDYRPTPYLKISVEGFYKHYNNYPLSLRDSISLANLGGDFGVIGNEPIASISKGRSYGLELLAQQKLSSSIYGILAFTLVRSEFTNSGDAYTPSSWDNTYILNLTAGKKFKRNWEVGAKFRLQGGAPYTPYDLNASANRFVWDINQQGVFDWDRINSQRAPITHGLDLRVDKKWFFKKWALNLYLDIQNLYNFQAETQPYIDVVKNSNGDPIINPNDPTKYEIQQISNTTGTVLPSIGIMVDF